MRRLNLMPVETAFPLLHFYLTNQNALLVIPIGLLIFVICRIFKLILPFYRYQE